MKGPVPFNFRKLFAVSIFMMLTSFLSVNVFAQAKNTKRTNIDFEDQLVSGEVKKPELFYLLQKKQFNFGKLIKLRENFIPEMTKTAEDIEKAK